jgi:2-aminoadipate transaminase
MTTHTVDLSAEVANLKRSVMRDLLGLAVDPEIISMAGGLPASELIPLDAFRDCLDTVLVRDGPRAMQYSPQYNPLREWITDYMNERGVTCDPGQVFITNGAQQGLAILSHLFLDSGQPAVIEEVTFTGIQQVTVGRGAAVRTIPTDLSTGADIEALHMALQEEPRPRLVVLIPDFHNPLGVSLSGEKRVDAAALAARYNVPLVEDDPYSILRFHGETVPPIKAHDEAGLVFYVGSFSKILFPAIRLGWIVASSDLIPKITALRESFDLETSTLLQRVAAEFLVQGMLEPHLVRLCEVNRTRSGALLEALEQHMTDLATWTQPEGGLFVWVTLLEAVDTWEMFEAAIERKVAYIPGASFAVHGDHRNTMRLSFSNLQPEAIRVGVARLAEVIRDRC